MVFIVRLRNVDRNMRVDLVWRCHYAPATPAPSESQRGAVVGA